MKNSIQAKLTIMIVSLVVGLVALYCVITNIKLNDFFQSNAKERLVEAYEEIDVKMNKKENIGFRELQFVVDDIGNRFNCTIVVISHNGIVTNANGAIYDSLYSLLSLLENQEMSEIKSPWIHGDEIPEAESETKYDDIEEGYVIKRNHDKKLNSDYYDLIGTLGNGYLVSVRYSLASLGDSSRIANRFFGYVGAIVLLVGIFISIVFSRRFTKPIHEMATVADEMAKLNFETKVAYQSKDEIGRLGNRLNQLSEKLEITISELKTANNELSEDIVKKEQIDEMRKEFLSHVSHELKTPIALIQGYAEGLKENVTENSESREFYCDVIIDEANKMNAMVKKLLTLNQIEFGKDILHFERFDVATMVKNRLNSNEILFQEKNVKVTYPPEEGIYVWADEFLIEEAISNYISNAIHYVDINGEIIVRFQKFSDKVRLFVYNSGSQIPEEELDKIWLKFYKIDKARTREYGGNGIGLSIVAAPMESHNMEYGVTNKENGVEFYMDLDTST